MNTRIVSFLLVLHAFLACSSTSGTGKVTISGEIGNCTLDSVRLFRLAGNEVHQLGVTQIEKKGTKSIFYLNVNIPAEGSYLIGQNPNNGAFVLLGNEKEVKISGEGDQFGTYQLNSPNNQTYSTFLAGFNKLNTRFQSLAQENQMRMQTGQAPDPNVQKQIDDSRVEMATYIDSFIDKGGIIGRAAQFYLYRPFDSSKKAKYGDELNYFKAEYLLPINFNDTLIGYMPQLGFNFLQYTDVLLSNGVPSDQVKASLSEFIGKVKGRAAKETAILGILSGLEKHIQQAPDVYLYFGKMLAKDMPESVFLAGLSGKLTQVEQMAAAVANINPGGEAPEIDLKTPEGTQLKLSSLRGKYVLIDFWASWCGPCRKENPNVVRMYKQYHDKGFEILGVSLDNSKEKWMQAIQADGLTWKHVSDLAGWSSVAAKAYSVSSIPFTVLLDKNGKIIGKNLRGPALEEKLKEVLGN